MSGSQRRTPVGRRSARLEEASNRARFHENPAFESEEELVVVPSQEFTRSDSPDIEASAEDLRDERSEERSFLGRTGNMVNTRLRYSRFRGDGGKDVDDWMSEFEATAIANQEDVASRNRVFQGLLKGEALRWYQDVSDRDRNNWDQLKELFLRTFREVGGEARALAKLSKITMKPNESVRTYGQRVKDLIKKLTTDVAPSIQVQWYMGGFPEEMGFQIRQSRPADLREAMESAQNYENAAHSLRRSVKKHEKTERGKSKKYEKKQSRRRKFSESETETSGTGTNDSNTDSSSSESEVEASSSRRPYRARNDKISRRTVKVKKEEDDNKKMIKSIQESLEAIKVNLADNRIPRRSIPTTRANVWCTRCRGPGHYANECTHAPQKQIHFVDEEGVFYTLPDPGDQEEHINPIFQVQTGYGRGRVPQQLIRTNANPHGVVAGSSQGNYSSSRYPPGCCFSCGSPQHYANVCPFKGPGQGAPLMLPCQNCQEYGHGSNECPKPQKVRTLYKSVETPPRDQTALNYGSTAGIENSGK